METFTLFHIHFTFIADVRTVLGVTYDLSERVELRGERDVVASRREQPRQVVDASLQRRQPLTHRRAVAVGRQQTVQQVVDRVQQPIHRARQLLRYITAMN